MALIGRDRELGRLRELVAGTGGTLVVAGRPGVGKSALLAAAVADAAPSASGATVPIVHALRGEPLDDWPVLPTLTLEELDRGAAIAAPRRCRSCRRREGG